MKGFQIIADFHGCACREELLLRATSLEELCLQACRQAGLTVVAQAFHQFDHGGATGAVVLAESHLAVHTWPELRAVTLDLYVCNVSQDNGARLQAAYDLLLAAFQPARVEYQRLQRGDLAADIQLGN